MKSRPVVLADGGLAEIRPIQPADANGLRALHARLSRESIYFRYHTSRRKLPERELERFTHVDYADRMAFVATLGGTIVALASYEHAGRAASEPAEIAFEVEDAQQGRGIATLLLEALAEHALAQGLHRFVARVLPANRAMLTVFHDAGFRERARFEDGVVLVELELDPTLASEAAARLRHAEAQRRHASPGAGTPPDP